ncbi:hypothetical protein K0U00_29560, partial [Paenibacillus sepulcri]|nr:hypothetical protein [Paenibacillus sepulcri]
ARRLPGLDRLRHFIVMPVRASVHRGGIQLFPENSLGSASFFLIHISIAIILQHEKARLQSFMKTILSGSNYFAALVHLRRILK